MHRTRMPARTASADVPGSPGLVGGLTPDDPPRRDTVLIVDDTTANLDLLSGLLEESGYDVLAAPSGEAGIRVRHFSRRAARPHPARHRHGRHMDGVREHAAACKAINATSDIPVLFIAARDETASLVSGFEAGGLDYIVKPFAPEEVLSRVGTHLRISHLTRELVQKNNALEKRTAELAAANDHLRGEISRREQAENALHTADEKLTAISRPRGRALGRRGVYRPQPDHQRHPPGNPASAEFRGRQHVLITGESGTGKELVARSIHFLAASGPIARLSP